MVKEGWDDRQVETSRRGCNKNICLTLELLLRQTRAAATKFGLHVEVGPKEFVVWR